MKTSVYNQKGEEVKQIELPKTIFGIDINFDLIHQIVVSQFSNKRQNIAHTKTRNEVKGGGRKPWRQKGTGRARHGSIRSPLFKGGGVTFGPRNEKNYKKIVPEKMRKKALFMVLSGKFKDKEIIFIDDIEPKDSKTKSMKEIVNNLPLESKNTLILYPEYNEKIIMGSKNIPEIKVMSAKDINAAELLSFKFLIIPEKSIKIIENTFLPKKTSNIK